MRRGEPVVVYLTVNTDKRNPILARADVHALLVQSWRRADSWVVGKYVLMPDHIHLFCAPGNGPSRTLRQWVRYWKSISSQAWPRVEDQPVWQPDCWDRQLRTGQSYAEKWEYVRRNPVRAKLVADPDDWPYQGELEILEWHGR
jgi:putative transposase